MLCTDARVCICSIMIDVDVCQLSSLQGADSSDRYNQLAKQGPVKEHGISACSHYTGYELE